MLTKSQIEKLNANWGDKADSLACKAEVRIYDPDSTWEMMIYAMNPEDNDTIKCIVIPHKNFCAILDEWKLSEVTKFFNHFGEHPEIDKEFRPREVTELI
jgi:hypothetical protein